MTKYLYPDNVAAEVQALQTVHSATKACTEKKFKTKHTFTNISDKRHARRHHSLMGNRSTIITNYWNWCTCLIQQAETCIDTALLEI